jgi:oxygen-dependent protoporphyrinogen oxidase
LRSRHVSRGTEQEGWYRMPDRDHGQMDQAADVVVVGGGIAGLSAAWELRDMNVMLLEAEARVGGRLMSERRGAYWLNFGGHVLSGPDSATGRLLRSVGVEAADVPGVLAGLAVGKSVIAGPRVETYPARLPLTFAERVSLTRAGAKLRWGVAQYARATKRHKGESDAARRARTLAFRDDHTFAQFLGPLERRVDAILRATIRRSSGEPEQVSAGYGIGYFQLVWDREAGLTRNILGGSETLPGAISTTLHDRILTESRVDEVRASPSGVTVRYQRRRGTHQVKARFVVLATPADVTHSIARDLPSDTLQSLRGITYGPYVVGAFLTSETGPMPYDRIYAVATPDLSFNMLFNTANVLRSGDRQPGGALMVYSAADLAHRLSERDDSTVAQLYVDDLARIYPPLRGRIEEVQVKRWERGLPHPRPGRHLLQAGLDRPLGNIFLAGDYLGTTYVETAVETGTAAAHAIRRRMRSEPGLPQAAQTPDGRAAET